MEVAESQSTENARSRFSRRQRSCCNEDRGGRAPDGMRGGIMAEDAEIREQTALLQSSTEPLWERIRSLLEEKGLSAATSALAYSYPEDLHFELGVLVTADGRVYQYGFDYLHQDISHGTFSEWNNLTDTYQQSPYRRKIQQALRLLKAPGGSGD
jgi:hypothetical protein